MSGHSKWSTIKRKKGSADAARGKAFTKLTNQITIAARQSGGDPNNNVGLRLAIDKARSGNVPKDTIERAIKRGTGELEGVEFEEFSYEIVGPQGAAFIVMGVSDNTKRTVSELRELVRHFDAKLAEPGSQRWQFDQIGSIEIASSSDSEKLELAAIDAGAQDIESQNGKTLIVTAPKDISRVSKNLTAAGIKITNQSTLMRPKNLLSISKDADKQKMLDLTDALKEHNDIQEVFYNFKA